MAYTTVDERSDRLQYQSSNEADPDAQIFLDHLLSDGALEGDSGYPMEMPPWYDEILFRKGQAFMAKYRYLITTCMIYGQVAVLAIPSIISVVKCTRQSSTCATAFRRYVRTIMHMYTWYDYSPSADANSIFWTSIRAVRKGHFKSSQACNKQGAGQITQKDLALTQLVVVGYAPLCAERIELDDAEFLESFSHMWRVVGYLLGIKDEYNVCGRNWAETKSRLDIVMRNVFEPALENTSTDFEQMTRAMVDGLWPMNTALTFGSVLFFTKRLTYVKGYEYYKFDYRTGVSMAPKQKLYYYDLGWYDRFLVSYGLFLLTYLHKYSIVRWYLNFRVWLSTLIFYYLPYLAFWKFGIKHSYVRIFTKDGREKDFEFHLKSN